MFGVIYPLVLVGAGQLLAGEAAQGYPLYRDQQLVGFSNIGQSFTSQNYFWGRPSAVDYDASRTGGSNLGNQNPALLEAVTQRADALVLANPGADRATLPIDLLTASGAGLDPHISRAAADLQIARVSAARKLNASDVSSLVNQHTEQPLLGLFGPGQYVNVLLLNLALDELSGQLSTPR